MHRVVNLNSVGNDATALDNYKTDIKNELSNYDTHSAEVNDGQNKESQPTLGVNVDFNDATQANNFHDWLKQYITDRVADFESARTRVHDCYHAAGENEPCKIGDIWELS